VTTPKLPRYIVGLTAAGFIGFGVAFSGWPRAAARMVDISLPSATAAADFSATYGGFELGFGIFLLLCLRRGWLDAGLLAGALALGGFASVRLLSSLAGGLQVAPAIYLGLALEVTGVLLNLWGLRILRSRKYETLP
jgi:Domain of unknown function (DUF4345)